MHATLDAEKIVKDDMEYIPFWIDQVEQKTLTSHDGIKISYESLGKGTDRVVVLANGLGGRLYVWEPLIERLLPEYRVLTWDYRGLFESDAPSRIRRLAVCNHAEDLVRILNKEHVEKASIIGWSMGVQVGLEFTSIYPERIEKLVLINGTHGHALSTGFQPLGRVPGISRFLHDFIDFLKRNPVIVQWMHRVAMMKSVTMPIGYIYSLLRSNKKIKYMFLQYVTDIFGTDFNNYLRLFQELDAHSTYHHLREITHPTLVVWGDLDILTPAYQSREMVRKMPNARPLNLLLGTHFVLIEYPREVADQILKFLEEGHGK